MSEGPLQTLHPAAQYQSIWAHQFSKPGLFPAPKLTDFYREPSMSEREFFIDNLLVRIHFIIVMIRWTGLAPWDFGLSFPGSLISTFLVNLRIVGQPGPRRAGG